MDMRSEATTICDAEGGGLQLRKAGSLAERRSNARTRHSKNLLFSLRAPRSNRGALYFRIAPQCT